MNINNEQAQALFDAGGFIVLTGLPEGSEVGLDGTFHAIRRFSGFKFVPPGLHLLTWSPSSPGESSTGIPIRHAYVGVFQPRQRVVLTYDPATESVSDVEGVMSDDHLKTLDKELAPYPFEGLPQWQALINQINANLLEKIIPGHQVDGLSTVIGEEAERGESGLNADTKREGDGMRFTQFRLKRSWKDGAIGQEVTRYSQDKSWLFGDVVRTEHGGDPFELLGQLQLAFILLLHLSSYSALTVYKRFLPLFTRSSSLLDSPSDYLGPTVNIANVYVSLISTIAAQLRALPDGVFETELPELDLFFLDEIESLRSNLVATPWSGQAHGVWQELRKVGQTWRWNLSDLTSHTAFVGREEEEESDEEGEYAPIIVEM